ncbi:hypothetical protein JIQ42_08059 [Leishmania sp. Namibia]|uniref:hypothetical protein n=1 Tax=Leishmania sp. Namibia TaxID=2802991 RepID=UPI001B6F3A08|nr:hypothetical protein JIQ42_08059 [Leishmania sp. Namibia]
MDCVEAFPPHRRPPSPLAHRPPTSATVGSDGICSAVVSSGPNGGHRLRAAVSATPSKDRIALPFSAYTESEQRPPHSSATTAEPDPATTAAASASLFAGDDRHQGHLDASAVIAVPSQQQQQQQSQYVKHLSLSAYSSSASNLTVSIHSNTTASVTATATDASEQSTPLSGVFSYKQQAQRACAQRVVDEASHLYPCPCSSLRPSLDSRSSSHARDNEDDEVAADYRAASTGSVGVAAVAGKEDDHPQQQRRRQSDDPLQRHRVRCSAPSSKRPRQLPQDRPLPPPQSPPPPPQQQQQTEVEDEEEPSHPHHSSSTAMYIPDLTTFADSSSPRHKTAAIMAAASTTKDGADTRDSSNSTNTRSDHHLRPCRGDSGNTNGSCSHARVLDIVEYAGGEEVRRAMHPPQQLQHHGERSEGNDDAQPKPDATPQEPPPKRFAAGEGEPVALSELRCASSSSSSAEAGALSRMAHASICVNEEDACRRQEQMCDAAALFEYDEDDEGQRASLSTVAAAGEGRKKSASGIARRASQHQQRDNRGRKARVAAASSGSGSSSGVLASRRHASDSVTAGIPYDPSRFPPPSQPPNLAAPVTAAVAAATAPTSASEHEPDGPRISRSQPSCATPPDAPKEQHSPQAAGANASAALAPARQPIKLIETRYAFLALSFMMCMLCKLHKGEPIPSSDFHSHCIPPMTVTMYVQRLVRYCACSGEALLCSFLLLLKYVFQSGHPVTIYNAHRLLITSIVLGIKLRDDVYYSNVYYGRIGGISGREMNKLELLFLEKLEWETQVHEDEYAALLNLLAALGIDTEPTSAQLELFAMEHPDEAAAYVSDDEDDEVAEASAKLQQQGADSVTGPSTKDAAATAAALPVAEQQRLKVLRGAYRLHQWHTLVVPWLARLEHSMFAKAEENAIAAAAARKEEGLRWQQYHLEDERAAALRQQRPSSASSWLSPLSVQKRNTSGAATAGVSWASEPPYQSSSCHRDGSSGNSGFDNPRISSLTNFANNMSGGYFGASAAAVSQGVRRADSSRSNSHSGSAVVDRTASPSSSGQHISHQHHVIPGSASSSYYYQGTDSGRRYRSSGADAVRASSQVWHRTVATTAVVAADRPPRAASTSVCFDITNRVAAPSAAVSVSADAAAEPHEHTVQTQQHQLTPVAGTVAQLTSPPSSTTPGSGININAQPYYYVSSRMRKQQQQQVAAATPASVDPPVTRPGNVLTVTDTTTGATPLGADDAVVAGQRPLASALEGGSDARSSDSSFTSPACVNSLARFRTYATTPMDGVAGHPSQPSGFSSGIETVVSAMKMSGMYGGGSRNTSHQPLAQERSGSGGHNDNSASSSGARSHTFPTRPLAKSGADGSSGSGCEQVTSAHVPRWSPHVTHQAPVHRRSTFASQHSLGKKRSKPDSYKDY